MRVRRDLAGQRFGRWLVMAYAGAPPNQPYKHAYLCVCDCGHERIVFQSPLEDGRSKSCGCARVDRARVLGLAKRKHGYTGTPTINTYRSMLARCLNPDHGNWKYYGGRGIKICERWVGNQGFLRFLADLGPRPEGKTLDRKRVNRGYTPGDCRWATPEEQSRNRRNVTPASKKLWTEHEKFEREQLNGEL